MHLVACSVLVEGSTGVIRLRRKSLKTIPSKDLWRSVGRVTEHMV